MLSVAENVKLWRCADCLIRSGDGAVGGLVTDASESETVELLWFLVDLRISMGEAGWAADLRPSRDYGAVTEGECLLGVALEGNYH